MRHARSPRGILRFLGGLCLSLDVAAAAIACPFCSALRPTLCQEREEAEAVAIGEVVEPAPVSENGKPTQPDQRRCGVVIRQVLSGKDVAAVSTRLSAKCRSLCRRGDLLLLFGNQARGDDSSTGTAKAAIKLDWTARTADETVLAYFAKAPNLRESTPLRLKYFVKFLEHDHPTIAEDAYQEFGHAKYEDVAKMADALPYDKFRGWAADRNIAEARRGFYSFALGLASQPEVRRENLQVIERLVNEPADDVRAGFDGVLGALLLLRGEEGLQQIVSRYTANPKARDGDVRHALTALRFYWECGRAISRERLCVALHPLLERPEFAAAAIIDLSRWEDWSVRETVTALYERAKYPQPATRHAVVAYLKACPAREAAAALARLRERDPAGVADAERAIDFGGLRAQ